MANLLMAKKLKSLLDNGFIPIEFNANLVCSSWQELEANTNNCQACELYPSYVRLRDFNYNKQDSYKVKSLTG